MNQGYACDESGMLHGQQQQKKVTKIEKHQQPRDCLPGIHSSKPCEGVGGVETKENEIVFEASGCLVWLPPCFLLYKNEHGESERCHFKRDFLIKLEARGSGWKTQFDELLY